MNATSTDVAKRAGVSRATVSQILNGNGERFAADTAARVLAAARDLDYQPSVAGRTLRRGSSDMVVALLPFTTFGGNIQDLFERMGRTLADHGYTLVLQISTASIEMLDRMVAGMKPAAVFSLTPLTVAEREVLDRREILAIDPPSVTQVDHNRAIGELQARTLIARGHTRLAYAHLQDERPDPFGFAREEGVREVAAEYGLAEIGVAHVPLRLEPAARALDALGTTPVAIACYNDDVAMALMSAARLRGLGVPDRVALIGMDHTDLSQTTVPALTTIEYDLTAAATAGTASLLRALGAGSPQQTSAPTVMAVVDGETI